MMQSTPGSYLAVFLNLPRLNVGQMLDAGQEVSVMRLQSQLAHLQSQLSLKQAELSLTRSEAQLKQRELDMLGRVISEQDALLEQRRKTIEQHLQNGTLLVEAIREEESEPLIDGMLSITKPTKLKEYGLDLDAPALLRWLKENFWRMPKL